ncbi:MAG: addiction module protein [Candidatus Electrothrix sp. ATG1]|nr:addiction module protein [Candidatus Electrothrix sp. ATG1]
MKTQQFINEALSLPVKKRTLVVDALLRSPNYPESAIDKEWAAVTQRHLAERRSGSVKPVPGNEIVEKVWRKFEQ